MDEIWTDQPPVPCQPVKVHPLKYAGVGVSEKLATVRSLVKAARATSLVVMAMDEVSVDLTPLAPPSVFDSSSVRGAHNG